ncbi:hypothetical protein EDD11_007925 [Mortierella claussenii]|nr:hypothetical protein EDD11_007925 [Mortierella claussenii]
MELFSTTDTEASSTSTPSTTPRKSPFRGFVEGSKEELDLLRSMKAINPFRATYGTKIEAWERIVENLQNNDRRTQKSGEQLMFEGATVRACQKRRDVLFAKQKERDYQDSEFH